jgi:hypothetical protein
LFHVVSLGVTLTSYETGLINTIQYDSDCRNTSPFAEHSAQAAQGFDPQDLLLAIMQFDKRTLADKVLFV